MPSCLHEVIYASPLNYDVGKHFTCANWTTEVQSKYTWLTRLGIQERMLFLSEITQETSGVSFTAFSGVKKPFSTTQAFFSSGKNAFMVDPTFQPWMNCDSEKNARLENCIIFVPHERGYMGSTSNNLAGKYTALPSTIDGRTVHYLAGRLAVIESLPSVNSVLQIKFDNLTLGLTDYVEPKVKFHGMDAAPAVPTARSSQSHASARVTV